MTIFIGLILIYTCSVGFSAKYREKYLSEKDETMKLREEIVRLKTVYEAELLEIYKVAREHGYKGE